MRMMGFSPFSLDFYKGPGGPGYVGFFLHPNYFFIKLRRIFLNSRAGFTTRLWESACFFLVEESRSCPGVEGAGQVVVGLQLQPFSLC